MSSTTAPGASTTGVDPTDDPSETTGEEAGETIGSTSSADDESSGESTGDGTSGGADCPAGTEGCACDIGALCDDGLACDDDSGLCLFEGMVYVPAGTQPMGCDILTDGQCDPDESPVHDVEITRDFQIGRTEVTQAEYAACVTDGACEEPASDYTPAVTPNHPVVRISWLMADTYCAWTGGRLPTEAEWEYAARGGDNRKYPWGNAPIDCTLANYDACGFARMDVGSLPAGASPFGALDMVGNVGEWMSDWYDDAYYASSPDEDPPGPDDGEQKVTKSQPFSYGSQDSRAGERAGWTPTLLSGGVGVRCARDLED